MFGFTPTVFIVATSLRVSSVLARLPSYALWCYPLSTYFPDKPLKKPPRKQGRLFPSVKYRRTGLLTCSRQIFIFHISYTRCRSTTSGKCIDTTRDVWIHTVRLRRRLQRTSQTSGATNVSQTTPATLTYPGSTQPEAS